MWPLIALAGLKYAAVDAPKERRDRTLAAETQRNSPWTGVQAGPVQAADPIGQGMQFGLAGAAMDQNVVSQANNQKLIDSQVGANNAMTKYYGKGETPDIGMDSSQETMGSLLDPRRKNYSQQFLPGTYGGYGNL